MSNIDNIKNYTVIDLEMTGLSAKNDKIIEIGAARVRGGEIVDTISTLVNPKQHIPQRVQELTGITVMWKTRQIWTRLWITCLILSGMISYSGRM